MNGADGVDLKVILLGSESVGKTSLMERFMNDRFNESFKYQSTIGAAYAAKRISVDDKTFILGVWDTAGCERYEAMSKLYYRGAKAAIICYDVTNAYSWERAKFWIKELRSTEEECKVYICATKIDVLEVNVEATPNIDVVERYAEGIQSKFFMTSSKNGENITDVFETIVRDYASNPDNLRNMEDSPTRLAAANKTRCCPLR